eukprot:CAMPEP_0197421614 /NCGR_PEP_ID=MMETSP1170-20131217/9888_1 /TAXON_ID=54406 /ORGANISM="Sarcinochrysis sp, Strain CCMP770" /LENGTH=185 /DNA_ID=CAMNT_0042948875 /DNA_START=25 /DNA_END=582 /DNA_ORIENTATION=-
MIMDPELQTSTQPTWMAGEWTTSSSYKVEDSRDVVFLSCLVKLAVEALIERGMSDEDLAHLEDKACELASSGDASKRPLAVSFDENDELMMENLDRLRREDEEAARDLETRELEEHFEGERQLAALRVEAAGRDYEERQLLDDVAVQRREEDDLAELAADLDRTLEAPKTSGFDKFSAWCSSLFA